MDGWSESTDDNEIDRCKDAKGNVVYNDVSYCFSMGSSELFSINQPGHKAILSVQTHTDNIPSADDPYLTMVIPLPESGLALNTPYTITEANVTRNFSGTRGMIQSGTVTFTVVDETVRQCFEKRSVSSAN